MAQMGPRVTPAPEAGSLFDRHRTDRRFTTDLQVAVAPLATLPPQHSEESTDSLDSPFLFDKFDNFYYSDNDDVMRELNYLIQGGLIFGREDVPITFAYLEGIADMMMIALQLDEVARDRRWGLRIPSTLTGVDGVQIVTYDQLTRSIDDMYMTLASATRSFDRLLDAMPHNFVERLALVMPWQTVALVSGYKTPIVRFQVFSKSRLHSWGFASPDGTMVLRLYFLSSTREAFDAQLVHMETLCAERTEGGHFQWGDMRSSALGVSLGEIEPAAAHPAWTEPERYFVAGAIRTRGSEPFGMVVLPALASPPRYPAHVVAEPPMPGAVVPDRWLMLLGSASNIPFPALVFLLPFVLVMWWIGTPLTVVEGVIVPDRPSYLFLAMTAWRNAGIMASCAFVLHWIGLFLFGGEAGFDCAPQRLKRGRTSLVSIVIVAPLFEEWIKRALAGVLDSQQNGGILGAVEVMCIPGYTVFDYYVHIGFHILCGWLPFWWGVALHMSWNFCVLVLDRARPMTVSGAMGEQITKLNELFGTRGSAWVADLVLLVGGLASATSWQHVVLAMAHYVRSVVSDGFAFAERVLSVAAAGLTGVSFEQLVVPTAAMDSLSSVLDALVLVFAKFRDTKLWASFSRLLTVCMGVSVLQGICGLLPVNFVEAIMSRLPEGTPVGTFFNAVYDVAKSSYEWYSYWRVGGSETFLKKDPYSSVMLAASDVLARRVVSGDLITPLDVSRSDQMEALSRCKADLTALARAVGAGPGQPQVLSKLAQINTALVTLTVDGVAGAGKKVAYMLYLHGPSGAGKSFLMQSLAPMLSHALGVSAPGPRDWYRRNPADKFDTGYVGQPVEIIDDLGAGPKASVSPDAMVAEVSAIFNAGTNVALRTTAAALEDKGMHINNVQLLLAASNGAVPPYIDVLTNGWAFWRRFDLRISVRVKKEFCIEGTTSLDREKVNATGEKTPWFFVVERPMVSDRDVQFTLIPEMTGVSFAKLSQFLYMRCQRHAKLATKSLEFMSSPEAIELCKNGLLVQLHGPGVECLGCDAHVPRPPDGAPPPPEEPKDPRVDAIEARLAALKATMVFSERVEIQRTLLMNRFTAWRGAARSLTNEMRREVAYALDPMWTLPYVVYAFIWAVYMAMVAPIPGVSRHQRAWRLARSFSGPRDRLKVAVDHLVTKERVEVEKYVAVVLGAIATIAAVWGTVAVVKRMRTVEAVQTADAEDGVEPKRDELHRWTQPHADIVGDLHLRTDKNVRAAHVAAFVRKRMVKLHVVRPRDETVVTGVDGLIPVQSADAWAWIVAPQLLLTVGHIFTARVRYSVTVVRDVPARVAGTTYQVEAEDVVLPAGHDLALIRVRGMPTGDFGLLDMLPLREPSTGILGARARVTPLVRVDPACVHQSSPAWFGAPISYDTFACGTYRALAYSYEGETVSGDCGGMVFASVGADSLNLVGMHIAQRQGTREAFGLPITLSLVQGLIKQLPDQDTIVPAASEVELRVAFERIGRVEWDAHPKSRLHFPEAHRGTDRFIATLVPTLTQDSCTEKTSFFDMFADDLARVGGDFRAPFMRTAKVGDVYFDPRLAYLKRCADEVHMMTPKFWAAAGVQVRAAVVATKPLPFRLLTLHEALNGAPEFGLGRLNMSTSAGLSYPGGKGAYIAVGPAPDYVLKACSELEGAVSHLLEQLLLGVPEMFIAKQFFKDETLPKSKGDNTRVISVIDLHVLLVERILLTSVMAAYRRHPWCSVGTAVYQDWDGQERAMDEFAGKVDADQVDGDFPAYDVHTTADKGEAVADFSRRLAADIGASPLESRAVYVFVMRMYSVALVLVGGDVVVIDGNTSGHGYTTEFNTIGANLILTAAVLYVLWVLHHLSVDVHEVIFACIYGDDWKAVVSPRYLAYVDWALVADVVEKRMGYKMTNGAKTGPPCSVRFDQVVFLKRRTVKHENGRKVGALELKSLYRSVCWHTLSRVVSKFFQEAQSAGDSVVEAYFHGREFFEAHRAKVCAALSPEHVPHVRLITWQECEERYAALA